MPDSSPAPAPEPKAKAKINRGDINQGFLDEIADSRKVAAAAVEADYAAKLAEVEMDATLPGQINTLAGKIEKRIAKLKTARVAKKSATKQEIAARDHLMEVIAPLQTAARRKFSGTDAAMRDAYYIGDNLAAQGLEEVLTAAKNILARLVPGANNAPPQDVLPGVKADGAIADLSAAITQYDTKNTEQGDQQSEASGALEAIQADVDKLAGLRRAVQLAADQAWPWRAAGVATIRKAFLLPANQPLKD